MIESVGLNDVNLLFQKPENWTPPQGCHTVPWQSLAFTKYIEFLLYRPVKIFIIISALVNTGISIYGALQLKVDFDPVWYLKQESGILQMRHHIDKYFPGANEFKGT